MKIKLSDFKKRMKEIEAAEGKDGLYADTLAAYGILVLRELIQKADKEKLTLFYDQRSRLAVSTITARFSPGAFFLSVVPKEGNGGVFRPLVEFIVKPIVPEKDGLSWMKAEIVASSYDKNGRRTDEKLGAVEARKMEIDDKTAEKMVAAVNDGLAKLACARPGSKAKAIPNRPTLS